MIETYLRELERALPGPAGRKRRILAETRAHLEDASAAAMGAGADRAAAEAAAVARFGTPRAVAAAFRSLLLCAQLTRAGIALAAALLAAVPVVYLITERMLPPATWAADQLPADLAWQRNLAILGLAGGLVFGAGAALLGRLGRFRLAVVAAALAVTGVVVTLAAWSTLAFGWAERVPGAGDAFAVSFLALAALLTPAAFLAVQLAQAARASSEAD